jgi:hypothetical protein
MFGPVYATNYGKLTVKLPLGNKQKSTNFAIASKAFKDSRKMDLGELAWVERNRFLPKVDKGLDR